MLDMEVRLNGLEELKNILSPKLIKDVINKANFNAAFDAKTVVTNEMKKVFDRPTPYILRSIYVRSPGTMKYHKGPEALLGIEWSGTQGRAPADILKPHIYGGTRPMKRSEHHIGSYWAPGSGAKLNKYGNIPGSKITQMLSRLKLLPEMGYLANVTGASQKRRRKPKEYFLVHRGNKGLRPGVWERYGKTGVRPILISIGSPSYRARFRFFEIAENGYKKNIQRRFDQAWREGLMK